MSKELNMSTVLLDEKVIKTLLEQKLIELSEYNCIVSNLKTLAERDEENPAASPRLITMKEAAERLRPSIDRAITERRLTRFAMMF